MQWKQGLAIFAAAMFAAFASASAAETINITIKGFKFTPAEVTAHVGDTVVWTNADAMAHTATAKAGDFDLPVPAGKTASLIVAKVGAFDYICKIHPSMKAKLTVE